MAELNDQQQIRAKRRTDLISAGIDPYPATTARTDQIAELLAKWPKNKSVGVAGRIRALRLQGGSGFADLEDESGTIQIFFQRQALGEDFTKIIKQLDLGDFISVTGKTFVTKAGQQTVNIESVTWLAKALRPLPSKWHGLEDVELRYRFRELDLIANPAVKELFRRRGLIVQTIRDFLLQQDFLEVETPILQALAGGATAKPFVTHHNSLDIDLFLRIAPELYLKRLIVGGFGRVFELARCFRNEGMDRDHNPEFTQVEMYVAYQDYQWMMSFIEQLLLTVVKKVNGRSEFKFKDRTIKVKAPFPRIKYQQAIKEYAGIDIDQLTDLKELRQAAIDHQTDIAPDFSRAKIIDEIFKTHVRTKLIEPTLIYDYPIELSPLAKKKPDDPRYTERFQLLMGGTEIANAFSELNDPVDQRARFMDQEKNRQAGDDEAQRIDETFIQSLEYGLPPTTGLGLGIDRLVQILTDQRAVKDVILFPTLKPTA